MISPPTAKYANKRIIYLWNSVHKGNVPLGNICYFVVQKRPPACRFCISIILADENGVHVRICANNIHRTQTIFFILCHLFCFCFFFILLLLFVCLFDKTIFIHRYVFMFYVGYCGIFDRFLFVTFSMCTIHSIYGIYRIYISLAYENLMNIFEPLNFDDDFPKKWEQSTPKYPKKKEMFSFHF